MSPIARTLTPAGSAIVALRATQTPGFAADVTRSRR
jgi:hypothetical protein